MLAPAAYDQAAFNEAWRNVLLYSEHTWGAWNSVSDSENPFIEKQWDVKQEFAVNAEKQSQELLHKCLEAKPSGDTSSIDVYNTTSWSRSEVVLVARELSAIGARVEDSRGNPVPSQRLSTGELAFLAEDVPALGRARFHLSAQEPHRPEKAVTIRDGVIENGMVRARIDPRTGDIVEIGSDGRSENLVDASGRQAVNQYVFLEGKDLSRVQTSGVAQVTVEEPGPLLACLRIESDAPGCRSLVRRVRLAAGCDWFELTNTVDKKRAPLNPHPGKGGPGDEFAQHQGKESLQFAFPFSVPGGKMHIDVPLAVMQPEADQLPGSCKNWLPVGRWVDVANQDWGATWVSLDAPLIEVGEISATMLGSQRDPAVWREHIEPTQKFYSWAMNNHWGTNYRAYQEGLVEFRYAIRPHDGYAPAAASRLAIGLSQPLLVSAATQHESTGSLLQIEPADVLATVLKPSDDGRALIVRLFGASGEHRSAKLAWNTKSMPRIWISDLSERPRTPVEGVVEVPGLGLVTLRVERG